MFSSFNPFGLFSSSGNQTPAADAKDKPSVSAQSEPSPAELEKQLQLLEQSIVLTPNHFKLTPSEEKEFKNFSPDYKEKLRNLERLAAARKFFKDYIDKNKFTYEFVKQYDFTKFLARKSCVIKTRVTDAENAYQILEKAFEDITNTPKETAHHVFTALCDLKQNIYTVMVKKGIVMKKDSLTGYTGSAILQELDDLMVHYDIPRGTTEADLEAHQKLTQSFMGRV